MMGLHKSSTLPIAGLPPLYGYGLWGIDVTEYVVVDFTGVTEAVKLAHWPKHIVVLVDVPAIAVIDGHVCAIINWLEIK